MSPPGSSARRWRRAERWTSQLVLAVRRRRTAGAEHETAVAQLHGLELAVGDQPLHRLAHHPETAQEALLHNPDRHNVLHRVRSERMCSEVPLYLCGNLVNED